MQADELRLLWKIYRGRPDKSRCYYCGRRMKWKPGGFWNVIEDPRFSTCRSCGKEQPHWSDVLELTAEEERILRRYEVSESSDLPACLECGLELLITRDGTTVFCMQCAQTWEPEVLFDVIPMSAIVGLAGQLPFPYDTSERAKELLALLEQSDIDTDPAFLVLPVASEVEVLGPLAAFKAGWKGESQSNSNDTRFVTLDEFALSIFDLTGSSFNVERLEHAHIRAAVDETGKVPFELAFDRKKDLKQFRELLERLLVIDSVNIASADALSQLQDESPGSATSRDLASQLQQLSELLQQGLLTHEEFEKAKGKLLN